MFSIEIDIINAPGIRFYGSFLSFIVPIPPLSYIIILENLNRMPLIPEDWDRTISVSSVGITPRIKKLTELQKESLIKSGETSTRKYLNK